MIGQIFWFRWFLRVWPIDVLPDAPFLLRTSSVGSLKLHEGSCKDS